MQTHAAITIAHAAKQLGIGSRTLFQLLRDKGVLSEQNIATRAYVTSGDLRNEHRSTFKRGTRIQVWYTVPLVTGRGMALLQEIVSESATDRRQRERHRNAATSKERAIDESRQSAVGDA